MTRLLAIALTAALFWGLVLPAGLAQPVKTGQASVDLLSERAQTQPGDTFYIALDIAPDPGWHVYWRNPGDAGLPPQISWSETSAAVIGDVLWARPRELPIAPGEIMDYGYDARTAFLMPVTVPLNAAGSLSFEGEVNYLICDEVCIPERAALSLTVPLGDAPEPSTDAAYLAEAIAKVPTAFEGEAVYTVEADQIQLSLRASGLISQGSYLRFFPYGNEIMHAAGQPIERGPEGASLKLSADPDFPIEDTLDGVIVYTDREGMTRAHKIAATAGPVLAGTTGILDHAEGPTPAEVGAGQAAGGGFNFLAIVGLALLGGIVLNLMPCVLPILSIKAFGLVQAAASGNVSQLRTHGLLYTAGVVSTFLAIALVFLALRSAGELVSLGFQLQYPAAVFALAIVMFLIGLWLLGVLEFGLSVQNVGSKLADRQGAVGAFFTGGLAAFVGAPCVGPFLAVALGAVVMQPAPQVLAVFLAMGLGMALPFLALSFLPGLQTLLPKPGAWMETLKQFFAFPVFLTAVWLVSVLGAQAGTSAAIAAIVFATAIYFAIWAAKAIAGRRRALALGLLSLVLGLNFAVPRVLATAPGEANSAYVEKVQAEVWSPARVAELTAAGRGIFVDFTASWCVTCQLNKVSTLTTAQVQQAFAERDIAFLVADYTNKDDMIGRELRQYNSPGVPLYLYYAPGDTQPQVLSVTLSPAYLLDKIAQ